MALNTFKKSNKASNENGTEVEGCTSNKITVKRKCIKLKRTEQIEHFLWSLLHNCLWWAPWNLSFVAIFSNIKVQNPSGENSSDTIADYSNSILWGGGKGGPKCMTISINWFPIIHYLHSYLLTFLLFVGATVLLVSATFLFCQKKKEREIWKKI